MRGAVDKMRTLATVLLASMLWAAAGHAAGEDVLHYTVQKDDTLIGVGQSLFVDPTQWPRVQRLNRVADVRRIPVGTVLRIPASLLRKVPREARVVFLSGEVSVDGGTVGVGDRVTEGMQLETLVDSFMTVELPDGSRLTLQPQSEVRIEALHGFAGFEGAQRSTFQIERGRIETDVQPQRGPAARYRIQTPTAIIGVRGTSFRVAADDAVTRTEMRAGQVAVAGDRPGKPALLKEGFGLVARAGQPLPPPVALLPAPDVSGLPAVHERPLLRFALAPVAGAVAYRGQVASDPDFTRIVAEARAAVPDLKVAGLPDGDYYLRARGIDSRGLEGRDAQRGFRLKARPEPPFVNAPRPGGKVSAGTVDFAWARAEGAASYRFALAASEDFTRPQVTESALTEPAHQLSLEAGTYFWRLASTRADGDQGPWGDPVKVTVRPPQAAPPPPAFDADSMFFAWGGEPGQRFDYQFAEDEAFATIAVAGQVDAPELKLPRPAPGAYFLRIRAIDPDGFVGAYSASQQVIVPAEPPPWLWAVPLLILL